MEDLEQRAIKGTELNPVRNCGEEEHDAVNVESEKVFESFVKFWVFIFRSQRQDFQTPHLVRAG